MVQRKDIWMLQVKGESKLGLNTIDDFNGDYFEKLIVEDFDSFYGGQI